MIGISCIGVQVADEMLQVIVVHAGLKSKLVLERDCVSGD
jgi:hypothetical protein